MSPEDFKAWLAHMRLSERRAALALGLSRPTVRKYRDEGTDLTTALACAALAAGLKPWNLKVAMQTQNALDAWRDQLAQDNAVAMEMIRAAQERDRAKGEAEVRENAEKALGETEAAIARGQDEEAALRMQRREAAAEAHAQEQRRERLRGWVSEQLDALALENEQVKSGVLARICAAMADLLVEEWSLDGLVSDADFEPKEG